MASSSIRAASCPLPVGGQPWCEQLGQLDAVVPGVAEVFRQRHAVPSEQIQSADAGIIVLKQNAGGRLLQRQQGFRFPGCAFAVVIQRRTKIGFRGNCDAEIDQMVLNFPIMADYALLPLENGSCAFLTHGHLFDREHLPPHKPGDVLVNGHFHVYAAEPAGDMFYVNPGSAALPKENQEKSYMVYENGVFTIKALETGEMLKTFRLF